MVDVLEYLEYRDFLKDWFAESTKDTSDIPELDNYKIYGFSVRCVKN